MKAILALSLVLITATSPLSAQQKPKRRPGALALLGPVRTVRIEHATVTNLNGELVEGPRVLKMTVAFSEDATNRVQSIYQNGALTFRIAETYDPDGRLLELKEFDRMGVLKTRSVNTYDTKNRLLERLSFRADGSMSSRVVYQRQGEQIQTEATNYDEHGGVVRVTTATVTVVGQPTPGEDLRERRIESFSYSADGTVRGQSSIASRPDGSQEYKRERSNGDWERAVSAPRGKNASEQIIYNRDGSTLNREHRTTEVDSYGNVVKMTRFVAEGDSQNFEPVEVTYWTMTYFGKD